MKGGADFDRQAAPTRELARRLTDANVVATLMKVNCPSGSQAIGGLS